MIAAGLILWTLLALAVGIVIGKVIAAADRREAARQAELKARLAYFPRSWSA